MVLEPLQAGSLETIVTGVNLLWVLVVTFLIFFMHAGFAMLEAGQVRSKNVANQLTKNLLTWSVGVTVFFLIGATVEGLAGGSGVSWQMNGSSSGWVTWLFGAVFAMTAATIVSGAVAGRAKLRAYITYTFLLAAVIYPVVAGMSWYGGGFLAELGFADFAGGMVVHGMGGIAGLTAAYVLGPRMGRYTTIAMGSGAIGAAAVAWARTGKVDTLYVANGLLAGLVGITAIPDTTTWWGAFLVGGLAGAQLPLVFSFVEKRLQIDDVCAVFPVHGSAGVLGTLMFPFVAVPGTVDSIAGAFLNQVIGVAVITAWTVVTTGLIWGALKAMGEARVTPEHEQEGLDVSEHGVETYPEFGSGESVVADGGIMSEDINATRGSKDD